MDKAYVIPGNLKLWHSGKVRDTALIPGRPNLLLPVASDRVSTHNVTHKSLVPFKGEILTAQMLFFALKVFGRSIDTHLVAWGKDIYKYLPKVNYDPRLHYRALVVKRMKINQKEFIFRDYLTGSLFRDYMDGFKNYGGVDPYGLDLPPGLPLMHHFKPAIFTPTMKSDDDEPLSYREVMRSSARGYETAHKLFNGGRRYLAKRGIALIDTKCEVSGSRLGDEWLTGDCSRMAWAKDIQVGVEPEWLDKEVFRQAAMRQWAGGEKVSLIFPQATIASGIRRYHIAFEAITGMTLSRFQGEYMS